MSLWKGVKARYRSFVRRVGADRRMDEEFRFHLAMEVEKHIRSGMMPAEARRRALVAFGGVERHREAMRDGRRVRWLDDFGRDVRVGVRGLWSSTGFTLVTLLTMALGLGATTAVFSAVDAVLLRPLPFADPDRIVQVDVGISFREETYPERAPDITEVRTLESMFSDVAAFAPGGANLSGRGVPRRVRIGAVTPDLFSMLGVAPALGRGFVAEEGNPGGPAVAILSDGLWRASFAGDAGVLGTDIKINGRSHTAIGVMPRGFAFPSDAELWVPLSVPTTYASFEYFRQYIPSRVVARLAPGATLDRARDRVELLFSRHDPENAPDGAELVAPFRTALVGDRDTALLVLLGATALVLLVACTNVTNLVVSRAMVRRREIAIRSVLGATSGRVLRQLLTESMVLVLIGSALGVAVAALGVRLLDALVPAALSGVAPIRIDLRVLGFVVFLALGMGVIIGVLAASEAQRTQPNTVLKSGTAGSGTSGESARLRRAFVVAQLSLALMLLVGSVLMLRSLFTLLSVDPGVRPERVATLELTLAGGDYPTVNSRRAFYESVLQRLLSRPEVDAAAAINELPLRGQGGVRFLLYPAGLRPESFDMDHLAQDLRVTPGYFETMGIRILRGRAPLPRADTLAPREVAISTSLANVYWHEENPIGRRLETPTGQQYEVVGVVADVRPRTLESDFIAQAYYSLLDTPYDNAALVARGRVPAASLTAVLQDAVRDVAPGQAVYNARTMEQVISRAIAPRRTNTVLITAFGLISVMLAAIGVYGVMAFAVDRRTREIGIRMALGAAPGRVLGGVVGEALGLALAGTVLGLIGAWMLSRVLQSLIFGVTAHDPATFVVAPLVLLAIAAAAALVPARRATRIDPLAAIRAE